MLARFPTGVTLGDGKPTRIANAEIVSGNYFDLLGLEPAAGRLLHASDDRTKLAHPVVVLGWTAFQRDFGGNPSAVGRTVLVNAQPMTIVGVAPKELPQRPGRVRAGRLRPDGDEARADAGLGRAGRAADALAGHRRAAQAGRLDRARR